MPRKRGRGAAKKASLRRAIESKISRRERKGDPQSRVGTGGRRRADDIDAAISRMQDGQSTDSNQ